MAATRKRPAPDGAGPSAGCENTRPRPYRFSTIDEYDTPEELGEGAFSIVTKARHRPTGDVVAVKWIHGDDEDACDRAAVLHEVVCLAACHGHPSILQIKGVAVNKDAGHLFLVTEFVGPSLRQRLTRPFSEDETRAFMRQLLGAAETLHDAGIIHRNITPENILVGPDGTPKICGFGAAMQTAKPKRRCGLEKRVDHTMRYCSPEQHIGMCHYTPAVDVWALGCVMAELLAGKPLFEFDTEDDVFEEILYLRDQLVAEDLEVFDDYLPELSQAGRELLAGLLSFEDDERLTAAEALKHPWFAEDAKLPAIAKAEPVAVSE
ncbi:hypothetical protein ACP70R_029187 [Stipagrostis hirtigluma subsp. patula]